MKMGEKEIAAELAEKYGMCTPEVNMDDETIKKYLEKIKNGSCISVIQEEAKIEMIDDERVGKLKEIALELLEKYEIYKMQWIENFSWNPEDHKAELKAGAERYRRKIEELTRISNKNIDKTKNII